MVKKVDDKAKELIKFQCSCCGVDWQSKVNRKGPRFCSDCVELRRSLMGFVNREVMTKAEVVSRAKTLLEV